LTATKTGEIHVWDRRTGAWQRAIPDPPRDLLASLQDGLFLPDASGVIFGIGPHVERLDVDSGESHEWIAYPTEDDSERFKLGLMTDMAVSRDSSVAATLNREKPSNAEGLVRLWNVTDGKLRSSIPVTKGTQLSMSLAPDGAVLYAVERRSRGIQQFETIFQLYDTATGLPLRNFGKDARQLLSQTPGVSPDGTQVAMGAFSDVVQLWDIEQGKIDLQLRGPLSGGGVSRTWYSPDGQRLVATVSLGGQIDDSSEVLQVWDLAARRLTHQFEVLTQAIAFSHDSRYLAVAVVDNSVLIYDLAEEHPQLGDDPPPTNEELENAYQQLGGGPHAFMGQLERYDLCLRMVAGGDDTIDFLRPKLLASLEPEQNEIDQWIDALRSEDHAERTTAFQRTSSLGDDFWKKGSTARTAPLSRTEHARLKNAAAQVVEQRRMRLVIHVVRHIGTPKAIELLQDIVATHSGDRSQRKIVDRAREALAELAPSKS